MSAEQIAKGLTPAMVFRAVMIANGDNDPGNASEGMLENIRPSEREYVTRLTLEIHRLAVRAILQEQTP